MNGLPLTFLCYWGGNILYQKDGCPYDMEPKGSLRANHRWTYIELLSKLHRATKLDPNEFKLEVLCRFPHTFDHGIAQYCIIPIEDDSHMESMFDCSIRFPGFSSIQLFLACEPIVNCNEPNEPEAPVLGHNPSALQFGEGPSTQISRRVIEMADREIYAEQSYIDQKGIGEGPSGTYNHNSSSDSEDDEYQFNSRIEDDESDETDSSSSSESGDNRDERRLVTSSIPENITYSRANYPFYEDIGQGSQACDVHEQEVGVPIWNDDNPQLAIGLRFCSKIELQNAIKRYHIYNNWRFKVKKSTDQTWVIECLMKDYPCSFYLRGSHLLKKHDLWEVTRYRGPHTCLVGEVQQDHSHVDSKLIARELLGLVKEDADLKIGLVIQTIKDRYHKTVSYKKAWCGKQKAIAEIYGDWETSYVRMPRVLAAIQQYNPETIVKFTQRRNGDFIFDRVFWAFGQCIRAFTHCRPVITVDGTFLHGRYRGVILIAIGVDANDSLIPLAFAIVEKEDFRNWHWFLNLVHEHIVRGREVCIISDRHKGILAAFVREEQAWANTHHRFCLRHMRSNFLDKHKGSGLKRMFWDAGCAHQDRKLKEVLNRIFQMDREARGWFEYVDQKKWTLAHDGGYRYGMMTTNLSEIFNGVLKGARGMPVTAIVEATFYRCVTYFNNRRGVAISALGNITDPNMDPQCRFSRKIHERLARYARKVGHHHVTVFNNAEAGVYSVTTGRRMSKGGNVQIVRFGNGTCDCGKWLAYHVPCSHVMACCRSQHVDYLKLVSPFYNVQSYFNTWSYHFEPLQNEAYWNEYNGPFFAPNPALQRLAKSGRPRSRRIRNSMDWQGDKRIIHCSICKLQGHTRRRCPRNQE